MQSGTPLSPLHSAGVRHTTPPVSLQGFQSLLHNVASGLLLFRIHLEQFVLEYLRYYDQTVTQGRQVIGCQRAQPFFDNFGIRITHQTLQKFKMQQRRADVSARRNRC
jgi:hypothetical protein